MRTKKATPQIHPLTRWRFENGRMSLADLGKRVGVSAPHLSDIENGSKRPSFELLQRLNEETKLPVEQIHPVFAKAVKWANEKAARAS